MIFYFSGTGNSNYVAKRIADALDDALVNLNDRIKASDTSPVETGERVIIVTPTYAWRIPRVVRDWLLKTELHGAKQAWFVMTCGSEIGNADKYNRELCTEKGLSCMGTTQIVMPENYIAMFSAPQADDTLTYMVFAEQRLLAMCAEKKGIRIRALSDLPSLFGGGQGGYFTHIWGFKQQMREDPALYEDFCRRCAARLRRDFPDEAERIAQVPVLSVFFAT